MHWWIYVFFPGCCAAAACVLDHAAAITNLDVKGHHHTTPDSIHEQHKATCMRAANAMQQLQPACSTPAPNHAIIVCCLLFDVAFGSRRLCLDASLMALDGIGCPGSVFIGCHVLCLNYSSIPRHIHAACLPSEKTGSSHWHCHPW